MAKHIIVAIRDIAVNAFMRPFTTPTVGAATRTFGDEVNRAAPDNMMHNHPEDYELYKLATYEDETGKIDPLEIPERIAQASALKI